MDAPPIANPAPGGPLLTTPPAPVQPAGTAARRGARALLIYGGFFLLGGLLGLLILASDIRPPPSLPLPVALLALFPLSWLHALGHELGHALAARLVDFRVLLLAVGPLRLRATQTGARLERSYTSRYFGGFVSAVPKDSRNLRRRRFFVVAGGPLASVLILLLVVAGYPAVLLHSRGLAAWLYLFGVLVAATVILTLIPYQRHGIWNDGGQMLQLARGGPVVEQQLALTLLNSALIGGVRPRDLDPALLARALIAAQPSVVLGAHWLAYWRELDGGNIPAAAAHLDEVLAKRHLVLPPARAAFAAEAAWLWARHGGDPATARAWLELLRPAGVDESTVRRAEAAVLLAESRKDEAREAAEAGLRLLSRSADAGGALAERDLLEDLRAAAAAESAAGQLAGGGSQTVGL